MNLETENNMNEASPLFSPLPHPPLWHLGMMSVGLSLGSVVVLLCVAAANVSQSIGRSGSDEWRKDGIPAGFIVDITCMDFD